MVDCPGCAADEAAVEALAMGFDIAAVPGIGTLVPVAVAGAVVVDDGLGTGSVAVPVVAGAGLGAKEIRPDFPMVFAAPTEDCAFEATSVARFVVFDLDAVLPVALGAIPPGTIKGTRAFP